MEHAGLLSVPVQFLLEDAFTTNMHVNMTLSNKQAENKQTKKTKTHTYPHWYLLS